MNTTTIKKIVHLENGIFSNIGIIFIPAWTRFAKIKHFIHRNPHSYRLGVLLCCSLFYFEATSISFAISRFFLI